MTVNTSAVFTGSSFTAAGMTAGANNLTIAADALSLTGGAGSVTGSGSVTITPQTGTTSIGLAGAAGTLQVTTTDLSAFGSSFSQVTIGGGSQQGAITANTLSVAYPLQIQTSGILSLNGNLTNTAIGAAVTLTGAASANVLGGNVVTRGGVLTLNGGYNLNAAVLLDSTNSGGSANGANISVNGTLDNNTSTARSLTITAGNGNITLGGNVGQGAFGGLSSLSATTGTARRFAPKPTVPCTVAATMTVVASTTHSPADTCTGR